MRVLTACLLGALGLGALLTSAACSDSTDTGSGGAGGSAGGSLAGAGGKPASAGATSTAGATSEAGAGGAAECAFESDACTGCLGIKCGLEALDCTDDATCKAKVFELDTCVCDPANDSNDCFATFIADGGDNAKPLIECFADKCTKECQ